ncbi:Peptidyl-prolyl cis-trans isomerase NIMA-interacting 1 [Schistosoma japonicum]|nr:Peptidyl-prolyl cis-trans isomerase NIMA-interacting 1 [Schistosoma japonicum]KAH8869317.1 Peptidyl-prolyl cis-trans isomerase NIMA-interacting 1 [Schistosoma japonicum]KAH8869318.1 Peptidyl-prolyl cis-trans isomerase NIMA-interacting 1 [Schistosoma japonicum]KAH8869319.1 Peptidyl-prolyl cis-trans isomerase NIMA-interacting 1 [Schistosoma japonicum]
MFQMLYFSFVNLYLEFTIQITCNWLTLVYLHFPSKYCKTLESYSDTRKQSKYKKQIETGECTFEELARTESDCSSAHSGGDLDFFSRGQMQKPFEEAAFKLKIGEMCGPVYTDSGIHLIKRLA